MIPINEIELLIKYREENLSRDSHKDREVGMEIINVVREWIDSFLTSRAADEPNWFCKECSFSNFPSKKACVICKTPRR